MNLPIKLYYKILNYGAIEPPHLVAFKTAKVKPIFNNELNCNISGEIKLEENTEFEDFPDDDLNSLNEEWFMFLLLNQE